MFSGIVDHCGQVKSIRKQGAGHALEIKTEFEEFSRGESIAVNGVCLTLVSSDGPSFLCEVSSETAELTTTTQLKVGDRVNLERSLRMGDRNGGHYVLGHVDGMASVRAVEPEGEYLKLVFDNVSPAHQNYLFLKGSIALNGVSLTVNSVEKGSFSVLLVPHTLERTNLGEITVASRVNVEYDWMTKAIATQVQQTLALWKDQGKTNDF